MLRWPQDWMTQLGPNYTYMAGVSILGYLGRNDVLTF